MKTRSTFRAGGLAVPVIAAIMTAVLSFAGQPAKAVKSLVLEDLTWVEAEKALKDYDVALIALGARTKEHGPHLTLKTDYIQAEYLMRRVAAEVPVVVLPTLQYGYYPSFLEYPGSVSIGAGTFKNVVMDICKSMRGYGLKKFYVLNTGVSTIGPLAEAEKELAAAGITLRSLNVLEVDRELPAGLLKQEGGTHADEGETSMMLYIAPETVDMSKAVKDFDPRPGRHGLTRDPKGEGSYSPTGIYGDPTLATKEKGRVIVEATVRAAVRQVRELIAEKPTRPCRREIRGFARRRSSTSGPGSRLFIRSWGKSIRSPSSRTRPSISSSLTPPRRRTAWSRPPRIPSTSPPGSGRPCRWPSGRTAWPAS